MECFDHAGQSAVGLCKVCARGVCRACAVTVTNGLSCSEEHRELAEQLARTQIVAARNAGFYRMQRWIQPICGIAMAAMGGIVLVMDESDILGLVLFTSGIAIVGLALVGVLRKR
ncbi:hypothetical protein ACQQ2N_08520 [Dokdonella sp. MW10]|uniref:hypothetical protein n=1 Tax=Dokdonella sp. MW10 TaxID=2992926 RepID=UPI003F823ACC